MYNSLWYVIFFSFLEVFFSSSPQFDSLDFVGSCPLFADLKIELKTQFDLDTSVRITSVIFVESVDAFLLSQESQGMMCQIHLGSHISSSRYFEYWMRVFEQGILKREMLIG